MKIRQLSLFLENQPGALSRPMHLLAKHRINILTLSVADTQQFGILRLILPEWEQARQLFEKDGCAVKVTDVVAIEVLDRPGGLADILSILEKAGVNVEYMYAFTMRQADKGVLIFRFDDPDRAIGVLQQAKINVLGEIELFQRWKV